MRELMMHKRGNNGMHSSKFKEQMISHRKRLSEKTAVIVPPIWIYTFHSNFMSRHYHST